MITLRWMQPEDVDQVVNFCCDLSTEFIDQFLCLPNSVCNVILIDNKVVGFVFYQIKKFKIIVSYIAVEKKFRRKKLASELLNNVILKLNKRRKKIIAEISEYNLHAQLLFKKLGFKACEISRRSDEDYYVFKYLKEET